MQPTGDDTIDEARRITRQLLAELKQLDRRRAALKNYIKASVQYEKSLEVVVPEQAPTAEQTDPELREALQEPVAQDEPSLGEPDREHEHGELAGQIERLTPDVGAQRSTGPSSPANAQPLSEIEPTSVAPVELHVHDLAT